MVRGSVEEDGGATLAEYVERHAARTERPPGQRGADVPDAAPAPRPAAAQEKTLRRAEERARADVAAERAAYAEELRGLDPHDLAFVEMRAG